MAPSIGEIARERGIDVEGMVGQELPLDTDGTLCLNLDFYLRAEPGEKIEVVGSAGGLVKLRYLRTGQEFDVSVDKDYFRRT